MSWIIFLSSSLVCVLGLLAFEYAFKLLAAIVGTHKTEIVKGRDGCLDLPHKWWEFGEDGEVQ